MIDERVRSELARLADDVRPEPEPFRRLMARQRRTRRSRFAAGALVVASAVLMGVVSPLGAGSSNKPPIGLQAWAQRLVDAPARGTVAAAPGFADDLTARLVAQNGAGDTDGSLAGFQPIALAQRTVRALFVDDIGDVRVAVVALLPPAGGTHQLLADTVLAWIVAPRGAAAATLVSAVRRGTKPADTSFRTSDLRPFSMEEIGLVHGQAPAPLATVGLAPPGCEFASAPLPTASEWRTETTGSYIVRTPANRRAEWWRITCDGVVRYRMPAPPIAFAGNADNVQVSDADVQNALVGVRGSVDPGALRPVMSSLTELAGYALTARPQAVWTGRVSGIPPSDGTAIVVAAPTVGGGWAGMLHTTFDQPSTSVTTVMSVFNSPLDPRGPETLLAIRLGPEYPAMQPERADAVLAIAPPGAVTVRVVENGQQLAQSAVPTGAAVVNVPDRPGVVVEALTDTGFVLAWTMPVGPSMAVIGGLENWYD